MKDLINYILEKEGYQESFGNDIKVALDACKDNDFELFKANFKKNNNTFPYLEPEQVKIGIIKDNDSPIALIAYAYPDALKEYREGHEDSHTDAGHIFDFEVLKEYRGKGLADILMNGVLKDMKQNKVKGATLMAINQKVASHYKSKYGFESYEGEEKEESPMMYKKL